jgi:hypothetical protein
MNKSKLRDLFIVILFGTISFLVALRMTAGVNGDSMFYVKNIKKVSLFFIIVVPVVDSIEKYFFKRK